MSLKERKEVLIVALCRMLNIKIRQVTAGVVVTKDGKFLLVQEKMPIPGIFQKWNFPMGRVEKGEERIQAALREGQEESGFLLRIGNLIRPHAKKNDYDVRVGPIQMSVSMYEADIFGGALRVPPDLLAVEWKSFEEIEQLGKEGGLIDPYILFVLATYNERNFARNALQQKAELTKS